MKASVEVQRQPASERRGGEPIFPHEIVTRATLLGLVGDGVFRAELANGHRCVVRAKRGATELFHAGESVRIGLHPYDLSRGRLIGRAEE